MSAKTGIYQPAAHLPVDGYDGIRLTKFPKHLSPSGEEINEDNGLFTAEALRNAYGGKYDLEAIKKKYDFREFVEATPPKPSQQEIVKLDSLDFSHYIEGDEGLEARKYLARTLEKSLSTNGFINIINWGFPEEKLKFLRSLAQSILNLPQSEKLKFLAGSTQADIEDRSKSLGGETAVGFKPKGYWAMKNGVRDAVEMYNFRDMLQDDFFFDPDRKYPEIVRAFLPEIAEYFRHIHFSVLRKLCNLVDLVLELPEGYLWENFYKVYRNDLLHSGQGFGRFMHYLGMNAEDERLTRRQWLRGHSDQGAFTFITSQPILSLQIRDNDTGKWKYVGHRPHSLIVNIGDAMEFITGGYFKSTIHRVVAPPDEQRKFRRMVLIYFNEPNLTTLLDPEALSSPKLKRLGYSKPKEWDEISFAQWGQGKRNLFGKSSVNNVQGSDPKPVKIYGRYHERWTRNESP